MLLTNVFRLVRARTSALPGAASSTPPPTHTSEPLLARRTQDGLGDVRWWRFAAPAAPAAATGAAVGDSAADVAVLEAHLRLQEQGHTATWALAAPGGAAVLWLFLHRCSPCHDTSDLSLTLLLGHLAVHEEGVWNPGDAGEEVTDALLRALQHRAERGLRVFSYLRFGTSFIKCASATRAPLLACNLSFIVNRGSVCVKAAISRRRLRQLSAADTQEAARSSEADSRQQQVLVSPFGRQAALLGTCQADLVAELRRRLDNGQADTPLPTSQASHVEVLMNLPQEGNSSGRDTNSITNTDNSEGLRMVVSKDAVLLGSCSFWPRESREEGPAGKSSTDSSSTSSLGPEVDSDPGEEVVPAATARTPIMVEDKVMREPEESKPLGPAKRPRSSRGATQASLSAAASQASHMALTAAPSQQVSSGKPIDADMEDPEQDDEDAPLAKLLQMPSQAQPMKLSSFEMSLTTTPWDWEGDADTSGATNDADLLADFGDFGDFFEDDTLGLGEPPALMKEGEDRGHTMTPAPRRWPASALRIILRDSKLAELLNSRLEEKQRVQAVAWSDHLKQLQQSVESAAARQAVLAEAAVLQSSLAMPQGAMLPMRSSSLSSQSAASYAPSQSGKEIRAELLEHSYSYSAEPPRTPALPEPQLARPSCDQAYKQEEDEGGAEEADAGGTLHWPPPEAVLQIARKARIIVATELANLQVELHLLRCKAEQASALHKLGVSSLSRPAKGWVGQDRALHALAQQFLAPFDAALECGQGDLCRQDVESGGSLLWLLAEASPATVLYILREEVGPALVLAFGRVQGPLNASEWCLGKSMQLSSVTADTEEPAAAFGRGPESEPITPPHWHHSSPGPPHHTPLHLDTPSPLPGTPDEPGLPRQRLPQRSHHAKAPSMAVLPVPAVFVGYQDDWLKTSPAVLELWEKVPLEPFAPPKPVNYIVLCPQVEPHQECTIHFIRQLTTVYESSRLGSHVPAFSSLEASSKAPPGIIWVSSGSSSGNSEWRENFRLALQAARLAVKRLTDATTTHTDLDDDYCLVAYIVCPSDPLVAAGFVAECTELLPQATVQLLPFDALMKGAQGSSPGLPLPPSDLRELALAVYVKAVRLHQALAEEPQGPGGGKVQMLVNGGSASLPGQARFDETYEPLFILAEPGRYETVVNELEGKIAREGEGSDGGHEVEETRTVSSSEDSTNAGIGGWPSLHCCYAWVESEQEQCLVYAWTDSRGELLSIRVVRQLASMSPWTKSAFSNLLAHGLRIHELLMRGGQGGRGSAPLVIARLGSMSSGEMQDWETTISEKLRGLVCTSSVTAQPQANSDGLEEVGEDYQGGVTSVSLLSLEPSTDLQLVHTTESTATGTNDSSTPQGLRANTSAAATAMAVVKSLANQPASYLFAPKGFTTFSTQVQAEAYVVSALPACKKAEWPSTLHFTLVLQYEKRAQTSAGMASHASRHWLPLIAAELHGLSWLSWRRHTVLPIHVSAVYRFCHLLKVLNNAKVSLPLTSGMEASS
eukprot:SM000041S15427  [mRNA]  locus=s41:22678:29596:+ [translate_table: standard]